MSKKSGFWFRGDAGMSTFWIILIVLALAAAIFILTKFGPIYRAKWAFEEYMENAMVDLYSSGVDGMFEGLDLYAEKNNLPVHPDSDCTFEGDIYQPGDMVCNYDYKIDLPGYIYVFHVRAHAHVGKIPGSAV